MLACGLAVAAGGCEQSHFPSGSADSPQAHAATHAHGWLEAVYSDPQVCVLLTTSGGARVDLLRTPAGPDSQATVVQTVLAPCRGEEVRWLIQLIQVAARRHARPAPGRSVQLRWQIGGDTGAACVPDVRLLEDGAWAGILREIGHLAYVPISLSLAEHADAESLATQRRMDEGCWAYRRALGDFFRWGSERVGRTRPRMIYEPELGLGEAVREQQRGNYTRALEFYRNLWKELIESQVAVNQNGKRLVVSFLPGATTTRDLPSALRQQVIQELTDWRFIERGAGQQAGEQVSP